MNFILTQAEYDKETGRAYVELRAIMRLFRDAVEVFRADIRASELRLFSP